jgi:hypothetical protein
METTNPQYTVDGKAYSRKEALRLIWRHSHSDFKGKLADGTRTILVYDRGTTLVSLDGMTDAQINDKLPYCVHKDAQAKAKRAQTG